MVLINIDSFVVLVSGKFPCLLEIDLLFILNYKSATKLAKIYSTGNAMFIPTPRGGGGYSLIWAR